MLANNIALHVQISLTPLTPNSLLVLKHKVNLDTLYQIMSTSRLFPRPLSSGPCLLLFLIAHHIPATLPSSRSQQRPWGLCTCAFCCFCLYCSVPQTSAWLVLSHHLHFGSSKRHSPFVLLHFWPSKNILFVISFLGTQTPWRQGLCLVHADSNMQNSVSHILVALNMNIFWVTTWASDWVCSMKSMER